LKLRICFSVISSVHTRDFSRAELPHFYNRRCWRSLKGWLDWVGSLARTQLANTQRNWSRWRRTSCVWHFGCNGNPADHSFCADRVHARNRSSRRWFRQQLELLKQVAPRLQRAAVLRDHTCRLEAILGALRKGPALFKLTSVRKSAATDTGNLPELMSASLPKATKLLRGSVMPRYAKKATFP
jgi:hypothetical protein